MSSTESVTEIENREMHIRIASIRGQIAKEREQHKHNSRGDEQLNQARYRLRAGGLYDGTSLAESRRQLDIAESHIVEAKKQRSDMPLPARDDRPGSETCMADIEHPAGPDDGWD